MAWQGRACSGAKKNGPRPSGSRDQCRTGADQGPGPNSNAGVVTGVVIERHAGHSGDDRHRKRGGQTGTEQQGGKTAAENEEKMNVCFHGW